MESNKILEADVLDIIFEQKNKQYGAYELRKNYNKRARKAVMITATIALVVATIPLIAALVSPNNVRSLPPILTQVTIQPIEPIKPIEPPKKVEPQEPIVETKVEIFTPPTIIVAKDLQDDQKVLSQKDLSKTDFGAKKIEGPDGDPFALKPSDGNGKIEIPVIETIPIVEKTYDGTTIDQLPEFPGGEDAMMLFLKSHLIYPKRAAEEGERGKVVVEFVVDKEGKITEIDFLRKAGYGFDEEAKRVMGLMPDWKPGKINGQAVKARYQIPIVFELED